MEARCNYCYKNIYETSIYILIVQNDLIISSSNLHKNLSESENKFFSRILVLTIYEYFDDIHSFIGMRVTKELNENGFSHFIKDLNEIGKEIKQIKKSSKNFKKIRDNAVAHKTKNKIDLLELIFDVNEKEVLDIATETIKVNTKLVKVFTQIVNEISIYHQNNGQLENLCSWKNITKRKEL